LVFGNDTRLGTEARKYTLSGRLTTDIEVCHWAGIEKYINSLASHIISFKDQKQQLNLFRFPGISDLCRKSNDIFTDEVINGVKETVKIRNGAKLWRIALENILYQNTLKRLGMDRKMQLWEPFLVQLIEKMPSIISNVKIIRKKWILKNTRVYFCTIDSTGRMISMLLENEVLQ
jgi:hypothetical protein